MIVKKKMGALTLKPLAYKTRSWELNTIEILNFLDPFCGRINIQKRGEEIIRILPSRKNDFYWITDKIRFFFESLKKQRIVYPYFFYNQQYFKVNWNTIIIFFQYIKNIGDFLLDISLIEGQIKIKNFKIYNQIFVNNLQKKSDLVSQFYFNFFCAKKKLAIYESKIFLGDRNQQYTKLSFLNEIKQNQVVIINNISIINDFPKIWLQIKQAKKLLIGSRNTMGFFSMAVNNNIEEIKKLEKNKSLIEIIKKKSIILTTEKIKTKISQVLLTKNFEELSTKWLDNKIDYYKLNDELIRCIFIKDQKSKKKGINIILQSHGVDQNTGFNILLPITTFLEERSYYIDNYGEIQKSIPVNIRKINMRTVVQILQVLKSIFFNIQEKGIELKILKDLILLKYGIKNTKESFEFLKNPKMKIFKNNYIKDGIINNLFNYSEILKIKTTILKKKNNY